MGDGGVDHSDNNQGDESRGDRDGGCDGLNFAARGPTDFGGWLGRSGGREVR